MSTGLDIKSDFEVFRKHPELAYFDSASTTLVPRTVVDSISHFLNEVCVSSRRGAHRRAVKGNEELERARSHIAAFMGVEAAEVSFQASVESAVASTVYGYPWKELGRNKIVVCLNLDHSVLVSAFRAAQVLGLRVSFVPVSETGQIDVETFESAVDEQTGIVTIGHVPVGLGRRSPVRELADVSKSHGAFTLVDVTQSIAFEPGLVNSIKVDAALFSGNIGLMGPPGISVQWMSRRSALEFVPGVLGAASVAGVSSDTFEVALPPDRFESGAVFNIAGVTGLGAAIDYIKELHGRGLVRHLEHIMGYIVEGLQENAQVQLYGMPDDKSTIIGFNIEDGSTKMSCHDVALFLDQLDIAVRSGLLCAHPLVRPLSEEGIVQVSIHGYNTHEDCEKLLDAIRVICTDFL